MRSPRFLLASVVLGLVLAAPRLPAAGAEDPPRQTLPRLGDAASAEEVTGEIAASTRGRRGPVRLVLSLVEGEELAVLVAPDALCESLGLSLEPGETITVLGQKVAGTRPLLVAQAVVVEGRRVDLRDEKGAWLSAPGPESTPAREKEDSAGPSGAAGKEEAAGS